MKGNRYLGVLVCVVLVSIFIGGGCRRPLATIEMSGVTDIPWNDNLLLREGVVLTASSHLEAHPVESLLDNNPESFWHVDEEMVGLPAWVEADFGEGEAVVVTSLAARPRRDFGFQFFRNAQVQASHDGINWVTLAWIRQSREPGDRWYRCSFTNEEAYRFWRLLILDGHQGANRHFWAFADLALF